MKHVQKFLLVICTLGVTGLMSQEAFAQVTNNNSGRQIPSPVIVYNSCDMPSGLTASGITDTHANISWSEVQNANNYILTYRVYNSQTWNSVATISDNHSFTNLLPNTMYEYAVKAICPLGEGRISYPQTFMTLATCQVPGSLNANSVTANSATLSWIGTSGSLFYIFRYRVSGGGAWTQDSSMITSKIISGLTAGSAYEFQVQSKCSSTSYSAFSIASGFNTASAACGTPDVDFFSSTNITSTSCTVGWRSVSGVSSYNVRYRINGSSGSWITVSTSSNSRNLTSLLPSSPYEFQVQSVCSGSTSSFSTSGIFGTLASPCNSPNPSTFTTTNITSSTCKVIWTSASGALSYNVRYRVNGSSSSWTVLTSTTNSKDITGLSATTNYEFQVLTVCNSLTSSYSTSGFFTTLASPCGSPSVSTFTSSNITSNSCTVGWSGGTGAVAYNVRYRQNGSSGSWTTVTSASNSKNITGLTYSTQYEFQVQSVCSGTTSSFSTSGLFTTLTTCSFPTISSFSVSNITDNSCTIGWSSGTGASSYNLRYRVNGSGSSWVTVTASNTSKNLTGLAAATQYEFQVQSVCSGTTSSYSGSSTFTTLAIPCNLPNVAMFTSSNITSNSCTVGWASVSGVTGYNVRYRVNGSSSAWTSLAASTNSQNLTGLTLSTVYEFQVQCVCSGSSTSSFSASGIFTTLAAPCNAPSTSSFTTTNITTNSCTVGWSNGTGANSYNVRYRVNGTSSWTTVSASGVSKNITSLSAATLYQFQVQSICSGSTSSYSSSGTFTTLAMPCDFPVITSFSTTNITYNSCTINWSAGTGANSYNVRYRVNGSSSSWTTTTSSTTSKNISGLTSSTTYEFQVQSVCTGTTSSYSSSGTYTTLAPPVCNIPDAATFASSNITSSACTINWTANGAVSYSLRYRVNGSGGSWTTRTSTSATIQLSSLTASTEYEFQLQGVCSASSSSYSSSVTFITLAPPPCVTPDPLSFTSTNITSNSCTVNWTSTGANSYNLQYRINNSGGSWTTTTSSTTSKNLSGLTASTAYEFQVQGVCTGSSSSFSTSGIFTTLVSPCTIPDINLFTSTNITSSSCRAGWSTVSGAASYITQFRVRNTGSWSSVPTTTTYADLTGLTASTQYEFQVQTVCTSGSSSSFSASGLFTTSAIAASCGTPTSLSTNVLASTNATLGWAAVSGALSYNIQYRKTGTSSWTSATSNTNSLAVSSLLASTGYDFQVQAVCSSSTGNYSSIGIFTTLPPSSGGNLPVPDHIVLCMFENHAYQQIIGNSSAPRINALANDAKSVSFTQSFAIEHPSQPNYLDIFAGGNQGVTNNNLPGSHFTSKNLARELIDAGRTFKQYSEDLPSVGSDVANSGGYARKHNAYANWMGAGTNQVPSSGNQPYSAFPSDYTTLPTVSFISPNLVNSMHDGSGNSAIAAGDTWFYNEMNAYAQWAKTHNSLFILIFDEDDGSHNNQVVTIFTGEMISGGQNSTHINFYDILRTIEDMYGLSHAGNAANATPIHGCWTNGFRFAAPDINENISPFNWEVFPNPTKEELHLNLTLNDQSAVSFRIYSLLGSLLIENNPGRLEEGIYSFTIPMTDVPKGICFLEMTINDQRYLKKLFRSDD